MQLSTLNRVISLFLIGGLAVILAALLLREQIIPYLSKPPFAPAWGAAAGVFLALGLLSVTALAGVLVDALGNLTVRRFIRWGPCRDPDLAQLFYSTQYQETLQVHRMKYRLQILETIIATPIAVVEKVLKMQWSDAARSLFAISRVSLERMESELKLPNRELHYLVDVAERF